MQDDTRKSPPPDAGSPPPVKSARANPGSPKIAAAPSAHETAASPAWAKDLRQLYNAVVEEPLPDSFLALLSQLDSED